jgi:hypothetical protein
MVQFLNKKKSAKSTEGRFTKSRENARKNAVYMPTKHISNRNKKTSLTLHNSSAQSC